MDTNEVVKLALGAGAMHAVPADPAKIGFYEELREMCAMNSCGNYDTNWGCPPGCGEMDALAGQISSFQDGAVYQLISGLEDSFDFEGMQKAGKDFAKITLAIKEALGGTGEAFMVFGAGGCSNCETCTYPDKPCRFPDKKNISVEACGIHVSELCGNVDLKYINGPNTVTNTGLIVFNKK
ncbi:DUF2284 domain-containing protein [Christensenellaceae bacterium OttesenSCG-928-K19]|nr:DUF2284 domain-containing protein [Christensenellaceae bacterium OttesenSCG-928-K19]